MFRANLAKFSTRPDLKEMLLSTENKTSDEASPQDTIWGIGMAEDHPNVMDQTVWGQNLLGNALMCVLDMLRSA